ncbi:MAG: hypothetical protein JWO78_761 [Micavibrio sp.]|nr:hypothetical protein [Micavibrio sp.]
MALITYSETDFQDLPDQPTLQAIFNVVRQLPEAQIARNKTWLEQKKNADRPLHDSRPDYERMFARWIGNHKIIMDLPDLDKDAKLRVITLDMIEGAAILATGPDNISPIELLAQMRLATAQSPHAAFFREAIAEQETQYTDKTWPEPSVAETEYRIIDIKNAFLKARSLVPVAEHYKAMNRVTVHRNEYRWWTETINAFDKAGPANIPPTLYNQARDAV